MLGQRFRWLAIIRLALCQRLVFVVELLHAELKGKSASLLRGRDNCPLSPTLTSTPLPSTVLYNMQIRSWLRHLSSEISTFVILKIDLRPL